MALLQVKTFAAYPSASTLEWTEQGLLLMGDDAHAALLLDTAYSVLHSFPLFPGSGRMDKEGKADIESSFSLEDGRIVLLGSRSGSKRNRTFLLDAGSGISKEIKGWGREAFPSLKELNIEGAARTPSGLIMANRGNLGHPVNHLLFQQSDLTFHPVVFEIVGTTGFAGVSGLSYTEEGDRLFFTASVEATANAFEDGAIGDPYLGWIDGISALRGSDTVMPTRLIPLKNLGPQLVQQKIESLSLKKEAAGTWRLDLCADNDDGSSHLFRLRINPGGLAPQAKQ